MKTLRFWEIFFTTSTCTTIVIIHHLENRSLKTPINIQTNKICFKQKVVSSYMLIHMNLSRWLIPRITYFPKTTIKYCKLTFIRLREIFARYLLCNDISRVNKPWSRQIFVVNQPISVKSRKKVFADKNMFTV